MPQGCRLMTFTSPRETTLSFMGGLSNSQNPRRRQLLSASRGTMAVRWLFFVARLLLIFRCLYLGMHTHRRFRFASTSVYLLTTSVCLPDCATLPAALNEHVFDYFCGLKCPFPSHCILVASTFGFPEHYASSFCPVAPFCSLAYASVGQLQSLLLLIAHGNETRTAVGIPCGRKDLKARRSPAPCRNSF